MVAKSCRSAELDWLNDRARRNRRHPPREKQKVKRICALRQSIKRRRSGAEPRPTRCAQFHVDHLFETKTRRACPTDRRERIVSQLLCPPLVRRSARDIE